MAGVPWLILTEVMVDSALAFSHSLSSLLAQTLISLVNMFKAGLLGNLTPIPILVVNYSNVLPRQH